MEWKRGDFTISTDRERLDRDAIHEFLRNSYWATGIPREVVNRSIENALCFGVYDGERLVGFARVISDCATFAYLSDVFVLESHRGRGLSKWLMEVVMGHPDLQGLRRWTLATGTPTASTSASASGDPPNPIAGWRSWTPTSTCGKR